MDSQFHNWECVVLQKSDNNNMPKFRSNRIDQEVACLWLERFVKGNSYWVHKHFFFLYYDSLKWWWNGGIPEICEICSVIQNVCMNKWLDTDLLIHSFNNFDTVSDYLFDSQKISPVVTLTAAACKRSMLYFYKPHCPLLAIGGHCRGLWTACVLYIWHRISRICLIVMSDTLSCLVNVLSLLFYVFFYDNWAKGDFSFFSKKLSLMCLEDISRELLNIFNKSDFKT